MPSPPPDLLVEQPSPPPTPPVTPPIAGFYDASGRYWSPEGGADTSSSSSSSSSSGLGGGGATPEGGIFTPGRGGGQGAGADPENVFPGSTPPPAFPLPGLNIPLYPAPPPPPAQSGRYIVQVGQDGVPVVALPVQVEGFWETRRWARNRRRHPAQGGEEGFRDTCHRCGL
ncbi:hypothetical protein PG999_007844 [Apiospora kogelbergensis]|uniref:Uncharacterized protein n=1 Tax=Apiospora kogelbergensis TaxID=1337665 RepID=A0AAW0QME7_9PEZI